MPPMPEPAKLRRLPIRLPAEIGVVLRNADLYKGSVTPEKLEQGVDVVLSRDSVENEVEAVGVRRHRRSIAR